MLSKQAKQVKHKGGEMSPELIAKLLAPRKRVRRHKNSTGGKFEGRAGTLTRSRKGSVTRKANGTRYYVPTIEEWQAVGLCKGKPGAPA